MDKEDVVYTHTHMLLPLKKSIRLQEPFYISLAIGLPQLILKSYFAERQFCLLFFNWSIVDLGLPGWLSSKESTYYAGDVGSIPGLGRSPGGGSGNPLQYSCLEKLHEQRSLVGYDSRAFKTWLWKLKESTLLICLQGMLPLKGSMGLPWWLSGKESATNAGDMSLIPGPERFHMPQNN